MGSPDNAVAKAICTSILTLLYLPPISDLRFGYEAVNVEEQRKRRSSLLNWMRWIIRVRLAHPALGRGDIIFLHSANNKLLTYLRRDRAEVLLCVANLCETAQATKLDLSEWQGRVPVELFGGCPFPRIGADPYIVMMPGHRFLWLTLVPADEVADTECVPLEPQDRLDLPEPDRPPPIRPREKDANVPK